MFWTSLLLATLSPFFVSLCQSASLDQLTNEIDDSIASAESQLKFLAPRADKLGRCKIACAILCRLCPNSVTAPGQAGYRPLTYWSILQEEVTPACRIDVDSSLSIAITVKVSRLTRCPFAVKSGGHTAFAGGSSIKDGILINLGPLNMVQLSDDRTTAIIGPGNTWIDVYSKLDPQNISVIGGRVSDVGVGGLTLGGGISFASGRYGWACDNVRSYEVVLANGNIVNASPTSHQDLYWALRGGSGTNFGIVSRFELATFEQGLMWGGSRFHPMSTNISLTDALAKFNEEAPTDPFAHLYVAFLYAAVAGGFLATSGPVYSKPVANATIFNNLLSIPIIGDATSITTMGNLSLAISQPTHIRELTKTATFKNDAKLTKDIFDIYVEVLNPILNTPGLFALIAFQSISNNIMEQMSKNGGNVLGLTPKDGPLMIVNLSFGWSNAADDAAVTNAIDTIIVRSVALAKSRGLHNRFIYINYASLDQDVFSSYGPENKARLMQVRDKYDPDRVFADLQPGYFKLPRG